MMRILKRLGIGVLCAVAGYVVAVFASYQLIMQFSSNMHDRELEAGMMSFFMIGPAAFILSFILGIALGGRRRR